MICLAYGKTHTFKKSDIFPLKETVFEGRKFKVANNIDSYLTELYGDYMTLLPEDEKTGDLTCKLKI